LINQQDSFGSLDLFGPRPFFPRLGRAAPIAEQRSLTFAIAMAVVQPALKKDDDRDDDCKF